MARFHYNQLHINGPLWVIPEEIPEIFWNLQIKHMVVWLMQSDHFTLGRRDQLFVYVKMYMCVASTDFITAICWDTVQNQNLELTKDIRQWHLGSICCHNQLDCQAYMSTMTTQVQCLYRSCVNKLEPQSGECPETPHNISVDKQC